MKSLILSLGLFALNSCLYASSYTVTFVIEKPKTDIPTHIALKEYSWHENATITVDENSSQANTYTQDQFEIKLTEDLTKRELVNESDLCDLLNQNKRDRELNLKWNSILLTVQQGMNEEDIRLYWAPTPSSLFVNGESENYVLYAHQGAFPKVFKDGRFRCEYKIDIDSKH